ncbi:hypothetical protein BDP27DRAFT_1424792 [Rhodocollybia butyracea]|uniref:Uncharacterized protein n=1 Tax=Rhodocollybia butyracea TaxID=206335 RepID=A0A9P5PP67_9AGAR|nr:hypothetical protein BDP27DRAFT_1424792 [Rhodocollybia butyracea]
MPPKLDPLVMDFKPSYLLPTEQTTITQLCQNAREVHSNLRSSTLASVYAAPPDPVQGLPRRWWHTTDNDTELHITVRWNRLSPGDRTHIYKNGRVNFKPQRSPRLATRALPEGEEPDDSDARSVDSVEFWDEPTTGD